jgi:hypothetical protein
MSIIKRVERLLLHITPTSTRFALLMLNLAVLALGIHFSAPMNERWD